jgi:hypothetical protein
LLPFRNLPAAPLLEEGYQLLTDVNPAAADLNRLLAMMGDPPRSEERWALALRRSLWQFNVVAPGGSLVGFVRVTSDLALNANLWDLAADPGDPCEPLILSVLVHASLTRVRRELGGCSISLAAPPTALATLKQQGFAVDPGGIRAMGLRLRS